MTKRKYCVSDRDRKKDNLFDSTRAIISVALSHMKESSIKKMKDREREERKQDIKKKKRKKEIFFSF